MHKSIYLIREDDLEAGYTIHMAEATKMEMKDVEVKAFCGRMVLTRRTNLQAPLCQECKNEFLNIHSKRIG